MKWMLCWMLSCLAATPSHAGVAHEDWVVTVDRWGNPLYQSLALERSDGRLLGTLDGDQIEGEAGDDRVRFAARDARGATYAFDGTPGANDAGVATMHGKATFPDPNDPARHVEHRFTARRLPERPPGPPRLHELEALDYANTFSPHRAPVLVVWPGDRVHTRTVDSGGIDARGVTRALFGNPQVGPIFVAGAMPGDTLVVTIESLRLDRDSADSLDQIVGRARGQSLAPQAAELGKPVRWSLDRANGVARPRVAQGSRLAKFEVPLRPMLGGLAVAPGFGDAPPSTGDSGGFGGNMDFNEVIAGNTVYLAVQQPGALLYMGDAHALQGDGETAQYGLETSMDVVVRVDVVKGFAIHAPRVESPDAIMVLGQAGSLDEAVRVATTGLVQWLQHAYALDLSECAQVLGTSVRYRIANLAGRNVGVAAELPKVRLSSLRKAPG